jgi:CheY-like chemotaxis protein
LERQSNKLFENGRKMTILIVDDLPEKVMKIQKVIKEASGKTSHTVFVTTNVADTVAFLFEDRQIDLMILDLNLPNRSEEDIKPLAGLNVIKEINRRDGIVRPLSIIGLTAKDPVDAEAIKFFQEEAWSLISYDQTSSTWESAITNKINYYRSPKGPSPLQTNILYLASSPKDQKSLSLGTEQRRIRDTIRMSTNRNSFNFNAETGGTFDNFTRNLITKPPTILHLSGHGDEEGFAMEDALGFTRYIPFDSIEYLLKQVAPNTQCVILSACYSSNQAQKASANNIYSIGINGIDYTNVTENFSVGFYQGVCEKKSIEEAFKIGIAHASTAENFIPENIALFFNGSQIS